MRFAPLPRDIHPLFNIIADGAYFVGEIYSLLFKILMSDSVPRKDFFQ